MDRVDGEGMVAAADAVAAGAADAGHAPAASRPVRVSAAGAVEIHARRNGALHLHAVDLDPEQDDRVLEEGAEHEEDARYDPSLVVNGERTNEAVLFVRPGRFNSTLK